MGIRETEILRESRCETGRNTQRKVCARGETDSETLCGCVREREREKERKWPERLRGKGRERE